MSGITTQLEHTKDFRKATQESMKITFVNGPSFFTEPVSLEEIHSGLEEACAMHGNLMACQMAFILYEEVKTASSSNLRKNSANQIYRDFMALFIASKIGDALYERELQLTQDEFDKIKCVFEAIRTDYSKSENHPDQAMRLEIFELAVRYNYQIQKQFKGVFAPTVKVA